MKPVSHSKDDSGKPKAKESTAKVREVTELGLEVSSEEEDEVRAEDQAEGEVGDSEGDEREDDEDFQGIDDYEDDGSEDSDVAEAKTKASISRAARAQDADWTAPPYKPRRRN